MKLVEISVKLKHKFKNSLSSFRPSKGLCVKFRTISHSRILRVQMLETGYVSHDGKRCVAALEKPRLKVTRVRVYRHRTLLFRGVQLFDRVQWEKNEIKKKKNQERIEKNLSKNPVPRSKAKGNVRFAILVLGSLRKRQIDRGKLAATPLHLLVTGNRHLLIAEWFWMS